MAAMDPGRPTPDHVDGRLTPVMLPHVKMPASGESLTRLGMPAW